MRRASVLRAIAIQYNRLFEVVRQHATGIDILKRIPLLPFRFFVLCFMTSIALPFCIKGRLSPSSARSALLATGPERLSGRGGRSPHSSCTSLCKGSKAASAGTWGGGVCSCGAGGADGGGGAAWSRRPRRQFARRRRSSSQSIRPDLPLAPVSLRGPAAEVPPGTDGRRDQWRGEGQGG